MVRLCTDVLIHIDHMHLDLERERHPGTERLLIAVPLIDDERYIDIHTKCRYTYIYNYNLHHTIYYTFHLAGQTDESPLWSSQEAKRNSGWFHVDPRNWAKLVDVSPACHTPA